MNEAKAPARFHYAWVILAASCLMSSAILGVVQNGRGVFYHAVCTDLGIETSAFTLYALLPFPRHRELSLHAFRRPLL